MQSLIEGTIILIDKPLHWSSFQAVNKLKWAIMKKYRLKKFKIGHAGTLDPLATGLLILCTGKYTKQIPQIQDAPKVYTGTIALGATTPSYDLETEVDAYFPTEHITDVLIEEVKRQFTGALTQAPPLFSAIKKDGKRLYELARKGETTEVPLRAITIHDIGKALGSGAHLTSLRRTQIGTHSVAEAYAPEAFVQQFLNHTSDDPKTIL